MSSLPEGAIPASDMGSSSTPLTKGAKKRFPSLIFQGDERRDGESEG
jgi:hypothetical protein